MDRLSRLYKDVVPEYAGQVTGKPVSNILQFVSPNICLPHPQLLRTDPERFQQPSQLPHYNWLPLRHSGQGCSSISPSLEQTSALAIRLACGFSKIALMSAESKARLTLRFFRRIATLNGSVRLKTTPSYTPHFKV